MGVSFVRVGIRAKRSAVDRRRGRVVVAERTMTGEPDKAKPDKPKKPEPRRPGGKTKRGPDKWLLRIFRGYDSSGRRIYYSETFHGGSKDADKRLVELANRQKAGLPLKFDSKLFRD